MSQSDPDVRDVHSAYQQSMFRASTETPQDLLGQIKEVIDSLRPGIGSRSRFLVCHPDNAEALNAIAHRVQSAPDMFVPFGYRIVSDDTVPKTAQFKTGKIIWKDERFVTYSSGPAPGSPLSDEEYLEMCLYFGWAEEEIEERSVWYEINRDQFPTLLETAEFTRMAGKQMERINENLAREIFTNNPPLLDNRRCIVTGVS